MNQKARGFTIVELLIVIVVIGILAAISIVAYNGVSNNAHDSTIKSDLANFAKSAQLYHAERGTYPRHDSGSLAELKLRVSAGSYDTTGYNLYYCTDVGVNSKFAFSARSKSLKVFYASSAGSGVIAGTPSMSAEHGCGVIGETPGVPSGNVNYAYNRETQAWHSIWTNQ